MVPSEFPGTRSTLLTRLRDYDDRESWRIFFDRYWQFLYNVARKSGLDDAAAQDVVQETVIAVAKAMPTFQYDRERGSFKQWLLRIARRRIIDQLRKIYRDPLRSNQFLERPPNNSDGSCPNVDSIPEQIDAAWEEEWQRRVFNEAVHEVKKTARTKQFQVFDYCVLHEWPVRKVAMTLGLNAAQVYLAKHRVSQAVKDTARRIRDEWADGDSKS